MEKLLNDLLLSLVSLKEIRSYAADSGLTLENVIPEIKADRFKTLEHISREYYISPVKTAEAIIKEETGATARVILENEPLITKLCPVTNEVADYTILFAKAY